MQNSFVKKYAFKQINLAIPRWNRIMHLEYFCIEDSKKLMSNLAGNPFTERIIFETCNVDLFQEEIP